MRRSVRTTVRFAGVGLCALALIANAHAQPGPRGGDPGSAGGWGPGMMMGPGMMGGRGMGFMCNPRAAGMAQWQTSRIENSLKLTDMQKEALKRVTDASAEAAKTIEAACAAGVPSGPAERLATMEKRAEASLQAIRTVRPAFDAFYATLEADQKKQLESIGPRRWGWDRWRSR
jgi:hypothetical protein